MEYEQFFSHDLPPLEIRARKGIPAREQLVKKASITKEKRASNIPTQKIEIISKDIKNKKVQYLAKLPGQPGYEFYSLSDLPKYKDQIAAWDKAHDYGFVYTESLPKKAKKQRIINCSTEDDADIDA